MADKYTFGDEFEEGLLARLARDKAFYFRYNKLVDENYLESEKRRYILTVIKNYYLKYSDQLNKGVLVADLRTLVKPRLDKVKSLEGGPEEVLASYTEIVDRMYQLDLSSGEQYTIDKIIEFAKIQKLWNILIKTSEDLKVMTKPPDYSALASEFAEINRIGMEGTELGYHYFARVKERMTKCMHEEDQIRVSTGVPLLDDALSGGLGATEIGLIMGPPNRGKTAALINLAWGAFFNKKNVVYFTFESSLENILRRFDIRFTSWTKHQIPHRTDEVENHVSYVWSLLDERGIRNEIVVVHYPMESASVQDLDDFLSYKELAEGWKADVIMIDYLNICKHTTKAELWEGRNYREGKALAQRRKVPLWSAVQANKDSMKKATFGPEDIAEAPMRIFADADVVVGLCQTDEEKAKDPQTMNWRIGKIKEDDSRVTIKMLFENKIMLMSQDSNQSHE